MISDWSVPFILTSPRGLLYFNQEGSGQDGIYVLDPSLCEASAGIRVTTDSIPQGSGSILHREYVEGYTLKLGGWMMDARDNPACDDLLLDMWDELGLHTNALLCEIQADEDDVVHRRIQWAPTAAYGQDRILPAVRMLAQPALDPQGPTGFSFALHSPYPYAVDETMTTTSLAVGGTTIIHNPGNCPVYPDVKVHGPASSFTYTNQTLGLSIVYDSSRPGAVSIAGGHYGFFGHFANNVYLDGSGTNLKAGIDILNSDFFPLLPGANQIHIAGDGTLDLLWNAGFRT